MSAIATLAAVGLLVNNAFSPSVQSSSQGSSIPATAPTIARRIVAAGFVSTILLRPAMAFENGVPEMMLYENYTKYPGRQPQMGLQADGKLRKCDYELNCFSTSGDESHQLQMWKPENGSNSRTMDELLETILSYPPGQAKVDRGGYKIITADKDYLYVQFESLKMGFIDDVEFALKDDKVQVRSSSRLGFLDLGVNAKRLNWISAQLRTKGWIAPAITPADYPAYFATIFFTFDEYIRSVISETPIDYYYPR